MVTKWKKWNISVIVVYVLSVSLLFVGGFEVLKEVYLDRDVKAVFNTLKEEDYQNTDSFRSYISHRLQDFLRMACGDYVGGYGYYGYYENDTAVAMGATDAVVQEATAAEIPQEEAYEGWSENIQRELSLPEKKEAADNLHNSIKEDKNLLYRIEYEGKEQYTNMEDGFFSYDAQKKSLPSGYNFLLYFDGTEAKIQKDGKELDVYGDGYYREDEDWLLPGFKNYPGKEKWKNVRILMLVADEPVLYPESGYDEYNYWDGYWTSNELYYMQKSYAQERKELKMNLAFLAMGILLFAVYLHLKKEKKAAGKGLAEITGKLWFEGKLFLFLILPIILLRGILRSDSVYTAVDFMSEMAEADVPVAQYVSEVSGYFVENLLYYRTTLLIIFWLFYLFCCDLRYNKESYKKGWLWKFVTLLNSRNLKLPFSKKIVKRTYGIFFLTLLLFLLLSFTWIMMLTGKGWNIIWYYGARQWMTGMSSLLLAVIVALLITEYIYMKKNRQTAADMERLAKKISAIRDGGYASADAADHMPDGYAAEVEMPKEDMDVRQMAFELEEIRQGLETAVEERIMSERMKVELVANVSHDVKTPLTSIISYIELLKQEENLPDYIKDYVRILDEKSERLKNMVQDVFTVSKAASGQLTVEVEKLDLGKLLLQTLADMEEEISESPVVIKEEIPKEPVMVQADGGRMYRVFQNLIGNALKYSLEGSRVYVTLKEEGKFAVASVKNTSSQELDQGMDFAERFVRGDVSRTDGGSGLGLSIAKSFTEACGGTFELDIIADLFVVTVSFSVLE